MRKFLPFLCALLMFASVSFAQVKTVTGKVTDMNNLPVVGASVVVKGSKGGVVTGQDGSFSIKAPATAKQLVISSVGFEKMTVDIGSAPIVVSLKTAPAELSDVVVTGSPLRYIGTDN